MNECRPDNSATEFSLLGEQSENQPPGGSPKRESKLVRWTVMALSNRLNHVHMSHYEQLRVGAKLLPRLTSCSFTRNGASC